MLRLVVLVVGLFLMASGVRAASSGSDIRLVFSLDQGFGNGVVVNDDQVAVKRIVEALQPLSAKYKVYALLNPQVRDRAKFDRVLDILVAEKMPFVFEVQSSDTMTIGSVVDHCKPHDPRHGVSISLPDLRSYKKRYGKWLAGIRFMEVLAHDFTVRAVKTTNPEWGKPNWKLPRDSFFQPGIVEGFLQFAKQNGMFAQWSDWHWITYADWDKPQQATEDKLHAVLRRFPGIVTVTYANNEPNGDSTKRLPDWERCITKFEDTAELGLSDQSWLGSDVTCPVGDIISWAESALDKGFRYVQFEPAWYFFRLPRGTFGVQDYTEDPAFADRGRATDNLLALEKALLAR